MNIRLLCVGTLKEKYWREAAGEYAKRLGKYCTLTIDDIREERPVSNASASDEKNLIDAEGKALLKSIKKGGYVVALDVRGVRLNSEGLADKLRGLFVSGSSDVTFIIGGSLGLSEEVLEAADLRLSFSDMTFPHQLMRVILLEQIYRSFKIMKNEVYHK